MTELASVIADALLEGNISLSLNSYSSNLLEVRVPKSAAVWHWQMEHKYQNPVKCEVSARQIEINQHVTFWQQSKICYLRGAP